MYHQMLPPSESRDMTNNGLPIFPSLFNSSNRVTSSDLARLKPREQRVRPNENTSFPSSSTERNTEALALPSTQDVYSFNDDCFSTPINRHHLHNASPRNLPSFPALPLPSQTTGDCRALPRVALRPRAHLSRLRSPRGVDLAEQDKARYVPARIEIMVFPELPSETPRSA
mmetsp:Transcript_8242/g.17894  ORF Transcript_8242/g.17894 Transcript_8242/m.17894 type:complete len:171 (-) Transcript_8242:117-629(-)